jgi:hypothetical protein
MMILRLIVIFVLGFGVVSCGVKGDPLPRVATES